MKKFKLKNLVFASRLQNEDKKEVFGKFVRLCQHCLTAPYPFTKSQYSLPTLQAPIGSKRKNQTFYYRLQVTKTYNQYVYSDASVEKGILNFAKEVDADLIALSTHGRSGLAHLFTASVTKEHDSKML